MNTIKLLKYGFICLLFSSFANAESFSYEEIMYMREEVSEACYASQRNRRTNSEIPSHVLRNYCACYAEEILPINISMETLQAVQKAYVNGDKKEMLRIMTDNRGMELGEITVFCSEQAIAK